MKPKTLLELGRVSNLPTVFSNVLAGAALSGAPLRTGALAGTVLAGSLFYVGGMFLNDAFDAEIDAKERPERPIPSGRATKKSVIALGFAQLGVGLALLLTLASVGVSPSGALLPAAGAVTALAVIAYDRWHKGLSWSPVVMGICRAGLYVMGALSVDASVDSDVAFAAFTLLLYVVGLTHIARFENASVLGRAWPTAFVFAPVGLALTATTAHLSGGHFIWLLAAVSVLWSLRALVLAKSGGPNIGRAVVSLIAGISLLDALFAATRPELGITAFALGCTALTLLLQRVIRGT